jgi:P27 family predicted phage terminase small subunit
MTRGRKPDPGAEKRGTRKRPSTSRAPSQALALPDELALARPAAPDDLDPVLVPIWDAIMDDLGSRGANPSAFRAVDVVLIRTLVDAIGLHKQATDDVAEHGAILSRPLFDKEGSVVGHKREKNPAVGIQKDAASTIMRLTDSLGLNPAARVRLGVMQLAGQSILASLQKMMDEAT